MKKIVFIVFFLLLGAALFLEFMRISIKPWPADHFEDEAENFKYGSIGAEVQGIPYSIWRELPTILADKIPNGYEEFGFISEPGKRLPIGVSVRRIGVPRVGFNCGTCHVSTYTLENETKIVLGAPANALNIQAYIDFLIDASADKRVNAGAVIASAQENGRPLGFLDRILLHVVVFPILNHQVNELKERLEWLESRPAHGPGRTDAGNFWRERWNLKPEKDDLVGTVDFPSVWNQRSRIDGWFHWDGNNRSIEERNLSAALAGGAQEWLLEREAITRVSDWLLDFPPPTFPIAYDKDQAKAGHEIFEREGCQVCHEPDGASFGMVTSSEFLGTDRQRTDLFDAEMVEHFETVGDKYSWQFENYQVTDGYANMPLDGIWMRAPYLHNGSVPTLADLLSPPNARPKKFFRGCTDLDLVRVGFNCRDGFLFDTSMKGNSNDGHIWGTDLSPDETKALIEYLKSL